MRAEVDAIAVGVGTMLVDDPRLTVRDVYRPRPFVRVIFDRRLRTPPAARVFQTLDSGPVHLFCDAAQAEARLEQVRALERAGACIERTDGTLDAAFRRLAALGVLTVLLEGGPRIHQAAGEAGMIDQVRLFIAPTALGREACRWRKTRNSRSPRSSPCSWRWWVPTCRSPAMFTGLIEAVGDVVAVEQRPGAVRLYISADLAESLQVGESLAVNGVCLTGSKLGPGDGVRRRP